MQLHHVEWSPDNRTILFGNAAGEVHIYDGSLGNPLAKMNLPCLEDLGQAGRPPPRLVAHGLAAASANPASKPKQAGSFPLFLSWVILGDEMRDGARVWGWVR